MGTVRIEESRLQLKLISSYHDHVHQKTPPLSRVWDLSLSARRNCSWLRANFTLCSVVSSKENRHQSRPPLHRNSDRRSHQTRLGSPSSRDAKRAKFRRVALHQLVARDTVRIQLVLPHHELWNQVA